MRYRRDDRCHRGLPATLFAVAALLCATPTATAEDEAVLVLERVQAWLDGTKDLQAGFAQTLVSGALGAGLEESGSMYLERPGRMRWDYQDPERKVALVNGERTTLYLIEDAQLIRGRLDGDNDLLPTLLTGRARIVERFEATLLATPELGGEGAYRLRLAPRDAHEAFEQVVMTVRPPAFAIESAEVLDAVGNRVLYRFTDMRRNAGLTPGLFVLEPPPGVEVSGSHLVE